MIDCFRGESEPVENNEYFLTALRYIHQNPVKARLVKTAEKCPWSSYNDYLSDDLNITDVDFCLDIFSEDRNSSIKMYEEFMREANDDKFLEIQETPERLTDEELIKLFKKKYKISAIEIQRLDAAEQLESLRWMKSQPGISLRQISRVTGMTVNKIFKA